MSRFLIGIDLGTTNSALAYVDTARHVRGTAVNVRPFSVAQTVALGEVKERPLLPSFLYLPGVHDLPPGATALPWDSARAFSVGEFARNHGSKVPGRLVSSAKSWLCHAGVDRSAALLPWSAPPDVSRISPVEASSRYLRHMVEAWNQTLGRSDPECQLEKQEIVLTVPASFDDVARNLTVEAARKAGLEKVVLLEEPQAAFYCWLATHSMQEINQLKPGSRCLVIDVGGGTSDFSLIEAVEQKGEFGFVRQAVGEHLLLGGDNMDLALAKFVEGKFPGAGRLDATQYGLLTQACRQAKEVLLGPEPPASHPVTIMGRGRSVIAGTLSTQITRDQVRQVLFEGFFPQVAADAEAMRGGRVGLHEMGLPYVADPAITRHLAQFLQQQGHGKNDATTAPAAILFNGGVFTPQALQERILDVLHQWYDQPGKPWEPAVLSSPSLDLAVAWGAAYYAFLRHSGGKRIGGGIARSYYIGIAGAKPEQSRDLSVVCVVPQHLEEEQELVLTKPHLHLSLGQPVRFPLYTSTVRGEDRPGEIYHLEAEQLLELPPLHTVLRGGKRSSATRDVPVTLAARSTAIGTLELSCVACDGTNRWRLEFNIRDLVRPRSTFDEEDSEVRSAVSDVWPEPLVQESARLIRQVYVEPGSTELTPAELTRALETALDAPRNEWPSSLCRRLWDFFAEVADGRKRSPAHQTRWFNLVGWCLRPGFGDSLDRFRVDQLWKVLAAPPRTDEAKAQALRLPDGGADYWIMWRRLAGGLPTALQQALFNRIRGILLPARGKVVVKPSANELAEIWRVAASLERIEISHKQALGDALLKPLRRSPVPTYGYWALTRLGARQLLYGPLNSVVHPEVVQSWIEAILPFEPGNDTERQSWAFCLAQLARRTGQRALDIDDSHRASVLARLANQTIPSHWLEMVETVSELQQEEQGQMLGDALPIGLRLAEVHE